MYHDLMIDFLLIIAHHFFVQQPVAQISKIHLKTPLKHVLEVFLGCIKGVIKMRHPNDLVYTL